MEVIYAVSRAGEFFFFPRGFAHFRGEQAFLYRDFGDLLILFEEFLQFGGDDILQRFFRFGVAEFGFRLTLELDILHLDGQNGGKTFSVVVADKVLILFFQ